MQNHHSFIDSGMFSLPNNEYLMRGVVINGLGKQQMQSCSDHLLHINPVALGFMFDDDYMRTYGKHLGAFSENIYPPQSLERKERARLNQMVSFCGGYRLSIGQTSVHTVKPRIGKLVMTHHIIVKETNYHIDNECGTMYTQIDLILNLYEVGYPKRILEELIPLSKYIDSSTDFFEKLERLKEKRKQNLNRMLTS